MWYMYNLEPLQAWKYFNLASSAWYITSMINKLVPPTLGSFYRADINRNYAESLPEGEQEIQQSLTQSLYFSCYKADR